MRQNRSRSLGLALVASMLATVTFSLALAQDRPGDPNGAAAKGKGKRKGPAVAAGAPPKKNRPDADDPLAKNKNAKAAPKADPKAAPPPAAVLPAWPFSFKLKVAGADGAPLAASYYPPKNRFTAPVILLIHDRGQGRAGLDWQEPINELKGMSLAETLQEQGYAVLVPDLRGHGQNPRKALSAQEWRALPADLQAMYLFLVDRHNRGDFNLAKLGVIAEGEGANLVAAWSALPGAAVSSEGRVGDLSALILISPVENSDGLRLAQAIAPVAPRVPMYLICGDRDAQSLQVVKDSQATVERHQRSRVSYYDTNLHGDRLVRFFPKVPGSITKFLDDPVKGRILDWEPRFLLTPVTYQSEGAVESKTTARIAEAAKKKGNEAAKKADPAKKDDGE